MTIQNKALSRQDYYALARAFAGLTTQDLGVSAATQVWLDAFDWLDPMQLMQARKLLKDHMSAILAEDPNGPPPTPAKAQPARDYIPPLPESAQLTPAALKAAEGVGQWYKEAVDWCKKRSPMTPPQFLEAGVLWVIGLAVARRVCIDFHERVYPHLYLILVAETSKYAKSTGLSALHSLVMAAMPHMLIPGNVTPEGMIEILSGGLPLNYDKLSIKDQRLIENGRGFAGQRGFMLDEYSSLIGASKKDYMAGFIELLMRLYDAKEFEQHYSKSAGMLIIKQPGISILGATTPAAMARASTAEMWENGAFARYLLMFRDQPLEFNLNYISHIPPTELVKGLLHLHSALPKIDMKALEAGDTSIVYHPVYAAMNEDAREQYKAYTTSIYNDMVNDDLDERLHGNYKRMHMQALKMALALACMDWSQAGAKGTITIELGHWAIAQDLAEKARASLHRLMPVLNETTDSKTRKNLMSLLAHHQEGITVREIADKLGKKSNDVKEALQVLMESGDIESFEWKPPTGRPTTIYKKALPQNPKL